VLHSFSRFSCGFLEDLDEFKEFYEAGEALWTIYAREKRKSYTTVENKLSLLTPMFKPTVKNESQDKKEGKMTIMNFSVKHDNKFENVKKRN